MHIFQSYDRPCNFYPCYFMIRQKELGLVFGDMDGNTESEGTDVEIEIVV